MKTVTVIILCALLQSAAGQTTRGGKKSQESWGDPPKAKKLVLPDVKVVEARETVESIFARNIIGLGGSYALSKIKSQVMRGYVTHSKSSDAGTCEYYFKSPEKMLMVINAPMGQFIEGYDGRDRWLQSPFGALSIQSDRPGSVLDTGPGQGRSSKSRDIYRVRGKARVGEREADIVEVAKPGQPVYRMYYDSASGLLLRSDAALKSPAGTTIEVKVFYDSYAEVDGIKVPINIRFVFADITITAKMFEVKHNVVINDALFASPKTASAK